MSEHESTQDKEMSIVEHLVDLRRCVIHMLIGVAVIFLLLLPFNRKIYELFARPVLENLLGTQQMLASKPLDIFLTPLKVCGFLAVFLAIPWILYQLWQFIAPAMYRHEKRLVLPLVFSTALLFYLGIAFAYWVILPLMFHFLSGLQLEGVAYMPDITQYLGLSLKIFFAFGIVFEVPVATVILIQTGVVEIETLSKKRPYIILIAFVVGMLLTPPDVFSQTLLAVPMLLLFELGILVSKYLRRKARKRAQNEQSSNQS